METAAFCFASVGEGGALDIPRTGGVEESDVDDLYDRWDREYGDDESPDMEWPGARRRGGRPVVAPIELEPPEPETEQIHMTYKPSRFEAGWLASSLRPFFQERLITDVLALVRGGKEATVYCCRGAEDRACPLVAAKVYRPRQFRQLRNDKMYREGRPLLASSGRSVKKTDNRLLRAVGKKTDFGVQVEHTSWLMYEYTTLEKLHAAGAAVPRPIAASDNAILMEYRGDVHTPAPALSDVRFDAGEAGPLFHEAIRNIRLMLNLGVIHGDLSAFNILWWDGAITLIDFPQVTNTTGNPHAEFILRRDITRVCEYFASNGIACHADEIMADLWHPEDQ
jgi:RIO kinase 1